MLTQAVEAEVAEFLASHADLETETGRQRLVRHGHLPEREVMTGIGPIAVRQQHEAELAGDGIEGAIRKGQCLGRPLLPINGG